ncbi:hypothetical protein JM93_04433 [Roseibium hamelinense]|uniref:Uncharacterized protein n=1 Tax=Roseibium hamelinense TaxID=150831 RepID=A0A562SBL3_9HYPH|nr:hypothetical protein JM93_04433 [Roseibium hamelinense]
MLPRFALLERICDALSAIACLSAGLLLPLG